MPDRTELPALSAHPKYLQHFTSEAVDIHTAILPVLCPGKAGGTSEQRSTGLCPGHMGKFEREITGERIRDKIAASKKKGMWMGGPVPVGYHVKDRRLVHRVVYRERQLELEIPRERLKAVLGSRDVPTGGGDVNILPEDDLVVVHVPLAIRRRGAQLKLVSEADGHLASSPDRSLLTAIVRARDWAARIVAGASPAEIAEQEQVTDGYVSQLLPLAFSTFTSAPNNRRY